MTPADTVEMLRRQGLRPPRTLTVAITGACNLACRHCWVGAGEPGSAAHVSPATLRRLVEDFAAMGGEGVRLTGGEPLCHPGWLEFVQFSRRIGLRGIALQTNGLLFGDEEVAALRELDFPGLAIQVSLDGASAATHDLVRGEGAFRGALDGIRRLARGGLAPRLTLFFTEMRHNLEEVPAVLELAAESGIGSVVTGAVVSCGRAAEGSAIAPADTNQYLRLLQRYETEPRFRQLYARIGRVAAIEWCAEQAPRPESCTFVENPYLASSGRLFPCVMCHADDYAVAGVFEKGLVASFAEGGPLWSSLLRISRSRAAAISECRDCPGRASCAGGCMGRAWGSRGELLAADDRCALRRTVYQRV